MNHQQYKNDLKPAQLVKGKYFRALNHVSDAFTEEHKIEVFYR